MNRIMPNATLVQTVAPHRISDRVHASIRRVSREGFVGYVAALPHVTILTLSGPPGGWVIAVAAI